MGNENNKNKNQLLNIKNISTLNIHENAVNDMIFYEEKYLISVSKDKSLKITDLLEMRPKMEITDLHSAQITFIAEMKSKNLISCGDDKKIVIFNVDLKSKTHKILHKITHAHDSGITKVAEVFDNKILSVSFDKQIIFWELDEIKNEFFKSICVTEKAFVYDVLMLNNNEFVVCTEKLEINFYEFANNEIRKISTINNIEISFWHNILFKFSEKILLIGGVNCVFVVDLVEHKCIDLIESKFWIFCFCKLNESFFLTGDLFHIKLWKFEHSKIRFQAQKKIHNKSVSKILFNEKILISASFDNLIKIFDAKEIFI